VPAAGETPRSKCSVQERSGGMSAQIRRRKQMRVQSLVTTSALAIGLAMPAIAQQSTSTHRYVNLFKYTDQAIKSMTENPQDREAAVAKLIEASGGKMESIYFSRLPVNGTE
jgi:hypothetical protein